MDPDSVGGSLFHFEVLVTSIAAISSSSSTLSIELRNFGHESKRNPPTTFLMSAIFYFKYTCPLYR